jgi:hypothetical protein
MNRTDDSVVQFHAEKEIAGSSGGINSVPLQIDFCEMLGVEMYLIEKGSVLINPLCHGHWSGDHLGSTATPTPTERIR